MNSTFYLLIGHHYIMFNEDLVANEFKFPDGIWNQTGEPLVFDTTELYFEDYQTKW